MSIRGVFLQLSILKRDVTDVVRVDLESVELNYRRMGAWYMCSVVLNACLSFFILKCFPV